MCAAAGRRVSVLRLDGARRLRSIDGAARACDAGALLVCGPGWMQARVAAVAAGRDLPFACIPWGADDLLAHDLGAGGCDPAASLSALLEGDERALDLGEVNGVPFVNYVAIGRRRGGGHAHLDPLGRDSPAAVLVTNNHFAFDGGELRGRERLDTGELGVAVGRSRARGWRRLTRSRDAFRYLELFADAPVLADVDGWPRVLTAPLRFRVLRSALRALSPCAL
jgi:diacylglycerol kinase family enzyme